MIGFGQFLVPFAEQFHLAGADDDFNHRGEGLVLHPVVFARLHPPPEKRQLVGRRELPQHCRCPAADARIGVAQRQLFESCLGASPLGFRQGLTVADGTGQGTH